MAAVGPTYTPHALFLSLVVFFGSWLEAVSDACQDLDWHDPDGDSCADYAREGWCEAHWAQIPASGISTEVTAKQACCACGGGRGGGQGASSLVPPPPSNAALVPHIPPPNSLVAPPSEELQPVLKPAEQQQIAELPKVTLKPVAAPVLPAQHEDMKASPSLAAAPASAPVPCVPVQPQKSLADQIAEEDDHTVIPDLRRVMSSVHRKMSTRETRVSKREQNLAEREAAVMEREAALRNATGLDVSARKKAEQQLAKVQRLNEKLEKSQERALARATAAEQKAHASETKLAEVMRQMEQNSATLQAAEKEKRVMKDKLDRAEKRLAIAEVEREAAVQAAKRAEQSNGSTQPPLPQGPVTHKKAAQ